MGKINKHVNSINRTLQSGGDFRVDVYFNCKAGYLNVMCLEIMFEIFRFEGTLLLKRSNYELISGINSIHLSRFW